MYTGWSPGDPGRHGNLTLQAPRLLRLQMAACAAEGGPKPITRHDSANVGRTHQGKRQHTMPGPTRPIHAKTHASCKSPWMVKILSKSPMGDNDKRGHPRCLRLSESIQIQTLRRLAPAQTEIGC